MVRRTPEWIAKHDDQAIPPRVRVRVFEAHGGKDHITGQKIMPGDQWDLDHVIPLACGGEHRESNLAPALKQNHKVKTRQDVALKAKIARTKAKHLGIRKPKRPWPSRPMSGGYVDNSKQLDEEWKG